MLDKIKKNIHVSILTLVMLGLNGNHGGPLSTFLNFLNIPIFRCFAAIFKSKFAPNFFVIEA